MYHQAQHFPLEGQDWAPPNRTDTSTHDKEDYTRDITRKEPCSLQKWNTKSINFQLIQLEWNIQEMKEQGNTYKSNHCDTQYQQTEKKKWSSQKMQRKLWQNSAFIYDKKECQKMDEERIYLNIIQVIYDNPGQTLFSMGKSWKYFL